MKRSFRMIALCWVSVWLLTACATMETIAPATGLSGPYVHVDRSNPAGSRTGLALPSTGWPPTQVSSADPAQCSDERAKLEKDLGVGATACPKIEVKEAPAIADGDAEISSVSLALVCYPLGTALLLVEYEQTSTQCTLVTGIAVFHQQ